MAKVTIFAGFGLLALLTFPAQAANPIAFATSGPDPLAIPVHDEGEFDWSGFYVGVYGSTHTISTQGLALGVGVNLGVNTQFDFVLTGAEVAIRGLSDAAGGMVLEGQLLGRAGVVVGEDLALYGTAGIGLDITAPGDPSLVLGAGAEYALTDSVTLRAQYQHEFATTNSAPSDSFSFGANFHF